MGGGGAVILFCVFIVVCYSWVSCDVIIFSGGQL